MGQTYYPQSDHLPTTWTVAKLREELAKMPQDALVVFGSPQWGAFGSGQHYSIERVREVELERREHNCGKQEHYDEDTDTVTYDDEDYIQVFNGWKGVVIE